MNSYHCIKLALKTGVSIRELSAKKITDIKDAPQAQKRTAKFKKSVYIIKDLTFKGPYTFDERGLINNIRYNYALELLEAALQLPEWQKSTLPWEYLGLGTDSQYYLAAPNVGKQSNIPFELVTTKIEENVKVAPRGSVVMRVSDIEGTNQLTGDIKSATLQHLYFRFLLDIGDSGTHNILVREDYDSSGRLIAGIDLEEKRVVRLKEQQLDHLFKKAPSKKQVSLYHCDVCKIKSLAYNQLDQHTSERLSVVGINLERFKRNIELWESLN
jgi:hypothetical protein